MTYKTKLVVVLVVGRLRKITLDNAHLEHHFEFDQLQFHPLLKKVFKTIDIDIKHIDDQHANFKPNGVTVVTLWLSRRSERQWDHCLGISVWGPWRWLLWNQNTQKDDTKIDPKILEEVVSEYFETKMTEEDMDYEAMQNVLNLVKNGELAGVQQFMRQYNETAFNELMYILFDKAHTFPFVTLTVFLHE